MAESDDDSLDHLSDELLRKYDPERLLKLVSKRAGKAEKLDHTTRSKFERRLGVDLGNVRVFTGEFAQEIARKHSAEAVTIGNTGMILMGGSADMSPATSAGRALLAHELTHVAQSTRVVQRAAYFGDTPVATEDHEAEAEAIEHEELAGAHVTEDPSSEAESREETRDAVISRVIELLEEEHRLTRERAGLPRYRP